MSYRRIVRHNNRERRKIYYEVYGYRIGDESGGGSPEPETLQERYRNNFGTDTVGTGALPNGFTAVDDADAAYEIATDGTSEGGKTFKITKSGSSRTRIYKTLPGVPGDVDDFDVVMVFEVSTTNLAPGIIFNSSGEAGSATEYLLEAFQDSVNIWEGTAGSYNNIENGTVGVSPDMDTGTVYAIRFRKQGSNLMGRLWEYENQREPALWHAEVVDSSLSGGQVGINFPSSSGTLTVHFLSIAVNGTAATVLPEADLPANGIIITSASDGSVILTDAYDPTIYSAVIIEGDATIANLRGVTIDRFTGNIYLPIRVQNSVYRYDKYGKNKTLITDAITDPYGAVFDELTNKLFISSFTGGNVYVCDPDGSNLSELLSGSANGGYLSIDKINRKLFNIRGGTVYANDLDGSNEISFGTITSLLQAVSDGTTVTFADFSATGSPDGIFTKPYSTPAASFTNVNSLGTYEAITFNDAVTQSWAVRPTTSLRSWSQYPPTGVAGTSEQSIQTIKFAQYYYEYSEWENQYCVTLLSSARSVDMTDYLGTIYLDDMPASFWSVVQSNGGDIRISKADGTRIPHHVVDIDTMAQTGIVRFKYTGTMPAASDVDIYVFAGNDNVSLEAADSNYGQHNTYRSTVEAVYDFQEDPGAVSTFADATVNDHEGTIATDTAAWASGDQIDSPFGKAFSFEAADERYVSIPAAAWPNSSTDFTVRIKVRTDASGAGTFRDFMGVVPSAGIMGVWFAGVWDGNVFNSGMSDTSDNLYQATSMASVTDGTWYSITSKFTAADTTEELKLFADETELADANFANTRKTASTAAYIGCGWFNGNRVTYFEGDLAELMIFHEALSDGEIAAMDINQQDPSSFYTISAGSC